MVWRQVVSAQQACGFWSDRQVKLSLKGADDCLGRVVRDYPVGGLVYFQPDDVGLSAGFAGRVNPNQLQVEA